MLTLYLWFLLNRNGNFLSNTEVTTEGFSGNEDVRLRTAIRVPKASVGRVIGKGGKNVRDIQRMTGAMIKLPEDQATQGEEVMVEVFGNFMATQVMLLAKAPANVYKSTSIDQYKLILRTLSYSR